MVSPIFMFFPPWHWWHQIKYQLPQTFSAERCYWCWRSPRSKPSNLSPNLGDARCSGGDGAIFDLWSNKNLIKTCWWLSLPLWNMILSVGVIIDNMEKHNSCSKSPIRYGPKSEAISFLVTQSVGFRHRTRAEPLPQAGAGWRFLIPHGAQRSLWHNTWLVVDFYPSEKKY